MASEENGRQAFRKLLNRIAHAGFKKDFIERAILPDWWEDSCATNPDLIQDFEIRLARFLGIPLERIRQPSAKLQPPSYPKAQLRRVRDIDRDKLGPAIHSAIKIAGAVTRNLRKVPSEAHVPPSDAIDWRRTIESNGPIKLDQVLSDLWQRGIPVIPLDTLPTPTFQAMAAIVEGRPVIILGHKRDEPGRVLFLAVHEAGHISYGDCSADQPIVDEEEEIADDVQIERRADRYATNFITGKDHFPSLTGENFKTLAQRALLIEKATGADASAIIFAWARRTGDYMTATQAVQALYRHVGARHLLRHFFDEYVDLTTASDTDRALLRCVHGDPELDKAVG